LWVLAGDISDPKYSILSGLKDLSWFLGFTVRRWLLAVCPLGEMFPWMKATLFKIMFLFDIQLLDPNQEQLGRAISASALPLGVCQGFTETALLPGFSHCPVLRPPPFHRF
jgi:hypothetical protein